MKCPKLVTLALGIFFAFLSQHEPSHRLEQLRYSEFRSVIVAGKIDQVFDEVIDRKGDVFGPYMSVHERAGLKKFVRLPADFDGATEFSLLRQAKAYKRGYYFGGPLDLVDLFVGCILCACIITFVFRPVVLSVGKSLKKALVQNVADSYAFKSQ